VCYPTKQIARLEPPSLRLGGGVADGTIYQSPDLLQCASTPTAEHLCKLRVNARALRLDNQRRRTDAAAKGKISIRPNTAFMHMHMHMQELTFVNLTGFGSLTRHRSSELHKCLSRICGEIPNGAWHLTRAECLLPFRLTRPPPFLCILPTPSDPSGRLS
jgi:hypothetical protein